MGVVLAAWFCRRGLTRWRVPYEADRRGGHRRVMVWLAALTLVATALFAVAGPFWIFLLLSMVVGASRAAILPLGLAVGHRLPAALEQVPEVDAVLRARIPEDLRALRSVLGPLLGALRGEDAQEAVQVLNGGGCEEHLLTLLG